MNWLAKEIRTKRVGSIVYNRSSIPGTDCWEFVHQDCPMPLGCLWVRWIGKATVEILHVYVLREYRKCGVATRLLDQVKKHYGDDLKQIITGEVNALSGPWLKGLQFTQEPVCKYWRRVFPPKGKAQK